MNALQQMVRLHRWQLDEKRQKLAQLEELASQVRRDIAALDAELVAEQQATTKDPDSSMNLPAFAAICAQRRKNLDTSLAGFERSISAAREELRTAFQEVKTYESALKAQKDRKARKLATAEQKELNEIGLNMHQRRVAGR